MQALPFHPFEARANPANGRFFEGSGVTHYDRALNPSYPQIVNNPDGITVPHPVKREATFFALFDSLSTANPVSQSTGNPVSQ